MQLRFALAFGSLLSASALRLAAMPRMMAADAATLCFSLQKGEAKEADLAAAVASRRVARDFFDAYFTGSEFTVADATDPPPVLVTCLAQAPLEVMEVVLLSLIMGAADIDDLKVSRATNLVNAFMGVLVVRQSCEGLKDAVEMASGGDEIFIEDASGGNMELIRSQWGGILGMTNYDDEQYIRIKAALEQCVAPADGEDADDDVDA